MLEKVWPAIRALLITIVLLAQGVEALPFPDLKARHLKHRIGKQELKRWNGVLRYFGLKMTRDELAERGLAVGRFASRAERVLTTPTRPIARVTGIGQDWALFSFPNPYPGRLIVEVQSKASQ